MATTVTLTQVKSTTAGNKFRIVSTCSAATGTGFDAYLFLIDHATGLLARVCEVYDIVTYGTAIAAPYYRATTVTQDFDNLADAVAEASAQIAALNSLVHDWNTYKASFEGTTVTAVTEAHASVTLTQARSLATVGVATPPDWVYRVIKTLSLANPNTVESFNNSLFLFKKATNLYQHVCRQSDVDAYPTSIGTEDYYRQATVTIDYTDIDLAVAGIADTLLNLQYLVHDWNTYEDTFTGTVVANLTS